MFQYAWFIPLLFFAVRLMMVITFPLDGLLGFGDLRHFYNLAQMGLPFIDYWVEFPPVFPFLSSLLYSLAGVREHTYFYMLVIILSIAQAVTIYVFIKLCGEIYQGMAAVWRIFLYTLITLGLSYGWWYFDPLAVLFTLLGIYFVVKGRDSLAGCALAAGILVKFFPLLVIPAVWRFREVKRALKITLIAIGISAFVYLGLYLISPEIRLPPWDLSSIKARGRRCGLCLTATIIRVILVHCVRGWMLARRLICRVILREYPRSSP